MGFGFFKIFNGLSLIPKATGTNSGQGDLEVITSDGKLYYDDGTISNPIVTEAGTATLTNKILSGNTATNLINGSGTIDFNSTGTITVPNATDTLVGLSTTDTLTNKTLIDPTIATIENSGTLTLPTGPDTLVGRVSTDTLTNKTINGANNTLTIRAASDITGQLPIANGGTGQATKSTAFDALAPTTTKGDLVAFSTSNTRVPVGADNLVLTADSTQATGVNWKAVGSSTSPADTLRGNNTGSSAPTADLTPAQVRPLISKAPTFQIFSSSGSGTYTTPAGVSYIEVNVTAAGGGGGALATDGGAGGNSTFGTITAVGGAGGGPGVTGASQGGNASGGDINITGGNGTTGTNITDTGGLGGNGFFGGAGVGAPSSGGNPGAQGSAPGAGGGGGGGTTSRTGGAAGGTALKLISTPSSTYSYSVGAFGTSGAGSGGGTAAGSGANGIIIVKEFYL